MPFLIQDLFLGGTLGGLNCLIYAQTQRSTAAAAENWFYFVEKGRPGGYSWLVNQINFSHYPKTGHLIDILVEKCRKAEYVQRRVRFVNVQLSFLFVRTRDKNFECGIAQPI